MENMRISSFETYDRYLKALLLSLDKAGEIPVYEPDYLMVEDGKYIISLVAAVALYLATNRASIEGGAVKNEVS